LPPTEYLLWVVSKDVRECLSKFSDKSRDELIEEILRLEKENEKLKKQLTEKEKAELRRKELKFLRFQARKKRSKKPGQKPGHLGITRHKPETINRIIEQTLRQCPDCHHRLSATQEIVEHTQEDIIPARVEVTLYKRHRYYCKHCRSMLTAPHASDEVPHGRIGPNALIHMAILKYHHGLPGNKIVELFGEMSGLKITEGAIAKALQRMSEWLGVEMEVILKAIRSSPDIRADETGWNINGKGHWLWAFVNKRLACYKIRRTRGSKVVKEILGTDYGGILITDFYAAYNKITAKKQKCLVHLLREIRRCLEKSDDGELEKYCKKLKRIIRDAINLDRKRKELSVNVFCGRVLRIKRRLLAWSIREYSEKNLKRLQMRFLKHWESLVTFLEEEGIPHHNNLCERQIRHNVILRNRSYQNRSQKGAEAHEVLMSLIQTLRLQDKAPMEFLKKAYLTHRQGNPASLLAV
jgi:transposase